MKYHMYQERVNDALRNILVVVSSAPVSFENPAVITEIANKGGVMAERRYLTEGYLWQSLEEEGQYLYKFIVREVENVYHNTTIIKDFVAMKADLADIKDALIALASKVGGDER